MTRQAAGNGGSAEGGPLGERVGWLASLRRGQRAVVVGIEPDVDAVVGRRLYDLGFRKGVTVDCVRRAPLGSPTIFRVGEVDVCLRGAQARCVSVEVIS